MADYNLIAFLATGKLGVVNTTNFGKIPKLKVTDTLDVTNNITTGGTVDGVDLAQLKTDFDAVIDNGIASTDGSITTSGDIGSDDLVVETTFSTTGTANRSIDANDLASVTNGLGADLVGIYDVGSIITATTVADALQENRTAIDAIENNTITGGSGIESTGDIGSDDQALELDTLTEDWDTGTSFKITNMKTPTGSTDAATKGYVDAHAQGLDPKESVDMATAAALPACTASGSGVGKTLTADAVGVLTVDGIVVVLNDRVLVKNQVTGADNGVYKCTTEGTAGVAFVLTRATDCDEDAEVTAGLYVFASEGTVNADSSFVLTTNDPITVDTTALVFDLFSHAGLIEAGTGLTKTGDTINAIGGDGILANADDLEVDLATNPGLQFTSNKLDLKIEANKGLTKSASGLAGVANTAAGLELGASGFAINLEATAPSLAVVSTELGIKFTAAGGLQKSASGTEIKLEEAKGLSLSANGLAAVPDTTKGMGVGASGLAVDLATAGVGTGGLEFDGSGDLQVLTGGAKGIILTATGLEIEIDSTPDTCEVTATGLAVTGLPSLFMINDVQVSSNVTAANLNTLTDGSTATTLHKHNLAYGAQDLAISAAELDQLDGISANVTDTNLNTLTAGSASDADALHTHDSLDTLAEMDDVVITGPADDDLLQYDNATSKWVDRSPSEAGLPEIAANNTYSGTNEFNGNVTIATLIMDGTVKGLQISATVGTGGITVGDTLRWDASGQFVRRDGLDDKICAIATTTAAATATGRGCPFGIIPVTWATGKAPTAHGENVFVCNVTNDEHKWTTDVPTDGTVYPATAVGTGTSASVLFFPFMRMHFE